MLSDVGHEVLPHSAPLKFQPSRLRRDEFATHKRSVCKTFRNLMG